MTGQPLILEIQTGKYKGRRVKLTDAAMTIGRGDEARIRIASSEVSREHCTLFPEKDRVRVKDLNSRNGTFVDGKPVNGERILAPGGTLTVGPLTFTLIGDVESTQPRMPIIALRGRSAAADDLSDDEIANWLSDAELPTSLSNSSADTTITRHALPTTPIPGTPESPVSAFVSKLSNSPASPEMQRREFKSVGEEARDIIRRHFKMLGNEEAQR